MSVMAGAYLPSWQPRMSGPRGRRGVTASSARKLAAVKVRSLPFIWSAASVALATVAGLVLTSLVRLPNVSMVFLLAVLFAAARFGLWPALFASGLSFLAYNFFFIEPLHTFSVARRLFAHPAGDPARPPAAARDPPHLGEREGADLYPPGELAP